MEHLAARLHVDCDDTAVVRWADLAQCTLTAVQETSPAATTGGAILRRRMALNHDLDHAFAARNQRHPWPFWRRPAGPVAARSRQMAAMETDAGTAVHGTYVTAVRQLVDDQVEVLFQMVQVAAVQASHGIQRITVTREARSVTAFVGAQVAVFPIEAVTDRPADQGWAHAFQTGPARCLLPTSGGSPAEWTLVVQRTAPGDSVARPTHIWLDARTPQPVDEAVVAALLRSVFP